jgi:hypothetical protein
MALRDDVGLGLLDAASVKAIAKRLSISPMTVSSHAEHIYAKTGATNRATLALFAAHHGVLVDANIGSLPDELETRPGLPSRS